MPWRVMRSAVESGAVPHKILSFLPSETSKMPLFYVYLAIKIYNIFCPQIKLFRLASHTSKIQGKFMGFKNNSRNSKKNSEVKD